MSTPALDKLFAQAQYTLEIIGFEARTSLKGEDPQPVMRTALTLAIETSADFPGANSRNLSVRIVGPAATFDRTEDGQVVVGACRFSNGEYEVVVMATEAFLSHCLLVLSTMPRSRCFIVLTTQTKVEQLAEDCVLVLEAAVQAKPQ